MLPGAGRVERLDHLSTRASGGERAEWAAGRLPCADRAQEADPSLLGEIDAVTTTREPQPTDVAQINGSYRRSSSS
jgi:hypothetical protein